MAKGPGRPTKLTPASKRRVCELIRKGVPRERAARLAGIGVSTFHRWMADGETQETGIYREFREAVCNAEDLLVQKAVSTVHSLLDPRRADPSVRLNAAKFILTHHAAGKGEFSQRTEVTGAEGAPVQVAATVRPLLSNEQLATLSPEQLEATIRAGLGG